MNNDVELSQIELDTNQKVQVHEYIPVAAGSTSNHNNDIAWTDVSFKTGKNIILDGCYGKVSAGSLCAIMGPSGAGKTSLLNVLAGRSASHSGVEISGTICVGGQKISPVGFRKHIAYVMQENALMPTATAREALEFSASLRLPNSINREGINGIVNRTIDVLGLARCADMTVGNSLSTGISGGERKRISVGVEIITEPALLFLDEPTSGLDSFSASHLVSLLKNIAKRDATVLCTIHQPSSAVFANFDECIFMKDGRIFYQGSAGAISAHLSQFGYLCPPNFNPSDFVMFVLQTATMKEIEASGVMAANDANHAALRVVNDQCPKALSKDGDMGPMIHSSTARQILLLTYRELLRTLRDVGSLVARFGATIFLSVLIGLIFLGAGGQSNSNPNTFSAHFGAVMITTIASTFGAAQPTMLGFPLERPLFIREYSTGTYNAGPYFLSKILIEIPLTFLQCLLQYIIVYFMVDLQGVFIFEVLAAFGLGLAATSLAVVVGCAISDARHVTEVAPLLFVPQFLFAGFFIRTSNIPVFLRWAQYLCSVKYAMNLILITEFDPSNASCSGSSAYACAQVLSSNNVSRSRWWVYMLILFALFAGFRMLAALILVKKAQRFY